MSYTKGGPAFPTRTTSIDAPGMTLLDYFAGQALMGLVHSKDALHALNGYPEYPTAPNVAVACYEIADAMIAERNRRAS